jgi:hypothetical protein
MFNKSRQSFALIYIAAILLIALIYWPIIHGAFVWDDLLDLRDSTWLRTGDEWKHYIFRGYHYWSNYFRPLGIGLLTLQVRLFNDMPGPMHAVSLAMHLINTLLVGRLSWICVRRKCDQKHNAGLFLVAVTMLLYGLHPVLIEPIAWISCQFELLLTMLTVLGLIASLSIRNIYLRAGTVACLFFLAACTKEAAASFPLLLLIFDWLIFQQGSSQGYFSYIRSFIEKNWVVYAATFLAGLAYLAFRYWALGEIIDTTASSRMSILARLQEVSFLYMHYWTTLVWPMTGIGPLHHVNLLEFNTLSLFSALTDIAAVGLLLLGSCMLFGKFKAAGCMVVAVTVALLPVLHITSVDFDSSLYHDRYTMTALTAMCVILPTALLGTQNLVRLNKWWLLALASAATLWLMLAVVNIRTTLPLWSTNVSLWRWAAAQNPGYPEAENGLLLAYIDSRDLSAAHDLVKDLEANHVECPKCMLTAAFMAIDEHDAIAAARALDQMRESSELLTDKSMYAGYLFATGEMLALKGNLVDAEGVLRAVVKLNTLSPEPKIALAMTLASVGKIDEARQVGRAGIQQLPASERPARQTALNQVIDAVNAKGRGN